MDTRTQDISSDLRCVLHENTSEIHAGIEKIWLRPGGFASVDGYRQFLTQALSVHLSHGLAAVPFWGQKQDKLIELERVKSLRADLKLSETATPVVEPMHPHFAWGVAYVLNGAAMGAAIMLKRGDIPSHWPSRYFCQNQLFVQSGGLKLFFDRLNSGFIDTSKALAGANSCFDAFANPCSLYLEKEA